MNKTTQLRQQVFTAPKAAENVSVHAAITLPTTGTTAVTTSITNPDVPRNIRLKGNAATTEGLVVVLEGTDIAGQSLTESVTMGGAYATPTDSAKAFATVTKITVPTRGAASDSISVGCGPALGLDCFCDAYSFNGFSGVTSSTSSTTVLAANTVTLSASLDGSASQAINYVPAVFPAFNRIYG